MTIERTFDYRRVKKITDANPAGGLAWQIIISRDYVYLIEVAKGSDVGVWCFEPNPDQARCYYLHAAMTYRCRGRYAIISGLNAIKWLFDANMADHVIAPVPVSLRHARVIPRAAGLAPMGFRDGNQLYWMDRTLLNKSRFVGALA